jgi:hypothetical protein
MSSLPCISHRLFVAAVGNEGSTPVKTTQNQSPLATAPGCVTAIPLELLEPARPSPTPAARPLPNSAAARGRT